MNVFDLVATLSLDKSGYEEGIKDAEQQGQSLGGALKSAGKTVAVAGAAVAGVGAGLFKFADGVASNADQIDKMSQKLGLSAQKYQEWDYVLKISGTEMSNMSTGLKTLTNKFDDAKNGGAGSIEMFEKLGLSMEEIQGLSREELFEQVIFAFQGMEDSAERAALASDLFGKSGQELAPLFNTTADETRALIEEVNDLGGVMSDDAVKSGAEFKDSVTALKTAFNGAKNELGKELMPVITDLIKKITEFVKNGGIKKIIDWFKQMAPIIKGAAAAFVAFKAAMGIASIIKGVSSALGVLNAVMAANPIMLIVAAIAALVLALITLWNNCEEFRNAVTAIITAIATIIMEVIDGIKAIFEDIPAFFEWVFESAGEAIEAAWSGIVDFFSGIWDGIVAVFTGIGDWFGDIFSGAWKAITDVWDAVVGWFQDIWDGITGIFDAVVGGAVDFFGGIFGKAWDAVTGVFSAVGDFFSGVFQSIKDALSGVIDWFRWLGGAAYDAFIESNPLVEAISMGTEGFADFLHGVDISLNGDPSEALTNAEKGFTTSAVENRRNETNVNVYIGDEAVDDVVTRSENRRDLRSGGRS